MGNLGLPDYADSEKGAGYRKSVIPDCLCQLHEFIGAEEVERLYGVGDLKVDEPSHSLPGQERRAKWEEEVVQ